MKKGEELNEKAGGGGADASQLVEERVRGMVTSMRQETKWSREKARK